MNKEDIILQDGDIVYYFDRYGADDFIVHHYLVGNTVKEFEDSYHTFVYKIERSLKYKTILDVKFFKKERKNEK